MKLISEYLNQVINYMQEYLHLNILIKNLNFIYVLFTLFVHYLQQLWITFHLV